MGHIWFPVLMAARTAMPALTFLRHAFRAARQMKQRKLHLIHAESCAAGKRVLQNLIRVCAIFFVIAGSSESWSARRPGFYQAYARQGNGSHHSEDFSPGRSRPPGQFFWPNLGALAWRGFRSAQGEESLRLDPGDPFARAVVVRRTGDSRLGAD